MAGLAYYNEFDPFAAQWLRELIKAGQIAPGDVDERSISDVKPSDLRGYTQCHFFAGIGVWSYALRGAKWDDETPVWTGSCPCQPFSAAGRGDGFADERHLWPHWHHLIRECEPPIVFGEQVASKDGLNWFDLVHSDLEGTGYTVGAADLCAAGLGAPHIRQRLFFVGMADADDAGLSRHVRPFHQHVSEGRKNEKGCSDKSIMAPHYWSEWFPERGADGTIRLVQSDDGKNTDGSTNRVGRLRAYGNAIVAPVAQTFIEAVMTWQTPPSE